MKVKPAFQSVSIIRDSEKRALWLRATRKHFLGKWHLKPKFLPVTQNNGQQHGKNLKSEAEGLYFSLWLGKSDKGTGYRTWVWD